jgi:hypothetical protein
MTNPLFQKTMFRVAAFDMGIRNFAFAVADYSDANSALTQQTRTLPVVRGVQNIDLLRVCGRLDCDLYRAVCHVLSCFEDFWSTTDVFLVEQQMSQRHMTNVQSLKLSMIVIGWLTATYPFAHIREWPASRKTQAFCMHLARKSDRKKWAIEKVQEFYPWSGDEDDENDDPFWRRLMRAIPKKDDVCDCILMILTLPHYGLLPASGAATTTRTRYKATEEETGIRAAGKRSPIAPRPARRSRALLLRPQAVVRKTRRFSGGR